MSTSLPVHLLELRRSILAMAALVEGRVQRVLEAIVSNDVNLARAVRHGDRAVDKMDVDIERECIEVLALHQPVASDLRFVLAVLRVDSELERIADLAKGIAKRLLRLEERGFVGLPEPLAEMAAAVRGQLTSTISALANDDVDLAQRVRRGDDAVDDCETSVLQWVRRDLIESQVASEAVIDTLSIARALERIGDMCTNIAEDIIFLVRGEVVRHQR